jgi:hypothetical protein
MQLETEDMEAGDIETGSSSSRKALFYSQDEAGEAVKDDQVSTDVIEAATVSADGTLPRDLLESDDHHCFIRYILSRLVRQRRVSTCHHCFYRLGFKLAPNISER